VGTFGTGIFANDLASDVRDRYRDLVARGADGREATDTVLREWGRLTDDAEDGVQIWLSLAASQTELGRLEDRVRDRAIAIIDAGADLARWKVDAPEDVAARRRALDELRQKLMGRQPPLARVRRQVPRKVAFAPGDIVAFRLDDGRHLVLRVVGHQADEGTGDTVAVIEVAHWIGTEMPDEATIAALPALVRERGTPSENSYWVPLVSGPPITARLSVVGHFDPPPPPERRWRWFGLLPRLERGWHLAFPAYLRWDVLPHYALHLLGEGPDPDGVGRS
jgi:hypothetical protein